MKEAFWTVQFTANNQNFGSGVIVTKAGKIHGGDTSFTYIGQYQNNDGTITATVNVSSFNTTLSSAMGVDNYTLELTGTDDEKVIAFDGIVKGQPHLQLKAVCTFVETV